MGVNGLWTVIQPCARPTNLATLNRKRLAVDASIWIYQFLKAVRDKEGNALRNSHVVGFFRRICKLLWFGIRPVFVFDGGAPALKRATLQGRRRRREGRREDAVRTAGRLLAVQMQRAVEMEGEERRRKKEEAARNEANGTVAEQEEVIPDLENIVYAEEVGMKKEEIKKARGGFRKQDQYHLPELANGVQGMGQPDDPRVMSVEELEEYARDFNSGEDINLYDFSKIDFDGDFFKSLPPADRYNILNAARLRSRLRMGLSKEQLDEMFPNRMDFSRFQIERVRERNMLTQRLMYELGMEGTDFTIGGGRIAGEKNREYILVKNDGVEGGWALGVVSKEEKDRGEAHKPIDVDALDFRFQNKNRTEEAESSEDEFEDVPIEGVNRLPKPKPGVTAAAIQKAQEAAAARRRLYGTEGPNPEDNDEHMFVGEDSADLFADKEVIVGDEDEDLNRAIAMSLENQHGISEQKNSEDDEDEFEDVDIPGPTWQQRAVEAPKPIATSNGRMVAHIVNNRAAAAARRRESSASGDSDDLQAALASAAKKRAAAAAKTKPAAKPAVKLNAKNPFEGPLPFEKLDWKSSIFGSSSKQSPFGVLPKQSSATDRVDKGKGKDTETSTFECLAEDDMEGGFEREPENKDGEKEGQAPEQKQDDKPLPLPPWLTDNTDIRESIKKQTATEQQMRAEDEDRERQQELLRQHQQAREVIEIEDEDDDDDVEIIDAPPLKDVVATVTTPATDVETADAGTTEPKEGPEIVKAVTSQPESIRNPVAEPVAARQAPPSPSPEIEFEDIEVPAQSEPQAKEETAPSQHSARSSQPLPDEPVLPPLAQQDQILGLGGEDSVNNDTYPEPPAPEEFDDFSDPEEEELLAQMAEEAEEHARFASQLNHRSEAENKEAYERELKALRAQQKKDRRDADEVTQIMVTECQALLRLFGIPYITAPMEAEAQCAELVKLGLVDGIVTDDSDTFLFGGTRVYKNMFNGNKFVECYLASDLEKELSLSREELISLAQLLGSDYTEGLPGVGPVTAVEILSEFPGRDGLKEFKEWWQDVQLNNRPKEADASSPFRKKFRKSQATKLFLPPGFPNPAVFDAYLHPEVDASTEPFQWGVPNLEGLRQFLMATIGWSQERTDEVLVPVIKDLNKREAEGTQSNITRYFEGAVGVGAAPKEGFAPRVRARGSKRMADAVGKLKARTHGETSLSMEMPVALMPEPSQKRKRKGKTPAPGIDDDDANDDNDGTVDNADSDVVRDSPRARGGKRGRGKRTKA
ncbi:DNA repair protein rad2 [Coniochaeta pulveracea]|uniref:DNA repair protein rad2 n=1 Tax=Coniochaeta pulveracea TaxID=177199 RepID=A0A420Y9P6_9PEZI|nr:DNA repair protein rad2 [Coniochaeta pulveracea]